MRGTKQSRPAMHTHNLKKGEKIMEPQNYTILILVDDKPGALTRITGLFARRAYNIDGLTVVKTSNPGISLVTIVTQTTPSNISIIMKQIERIVDVKSVKLV